MGGHQHPRGSKGPGRTRLAALLLAACPLACLAGLEQDDLNRSSELSTVAFYEGSIVITVRPDTKEQADLVEKIVDGPYGVDSWTEWNGVGLDAQLMVPKSTYENVTKTFRDAGMKPKVMMRNVADSIRTQHAADVKAEGVLPQNTVVGTYPRIPALYAWYDTIASQHDFVTVHTLGKSFEGRDIKMVKISRRPGLPMVFVECQVHAREWIAMASCVWYINNLLTSTDPSTQELTKNLEFRFVPCSNPDGYEFTHVGRRLWRKNRNTNGGNRCRGVDLNRNWDARWGTVGISKDPCSDVYCGTKPFSEPETQAISKHVMENKARIKAYVAFHCYTQLWLVPPGAGPDPPDYGNLMKVGNDATQKVMAKHNQRYVAGSPKRILYQASGGSFDWAHDPVKGPGIKYSYTPELRPSRARGRVGFQLPVNEIIPASEEAFEGLKHVAQVVMKENPAAPAPTPPPTRRRRDPAPSPLPPMPGPINPIGRRRSASRRRRTRKSRRRSSKAAAAGAAVAGSVAAAVPAEPSKATA